MKRIRIGNDIAISWAIYDYPDKPHSLEGKSLSILMVSGGARYKIESFSVVENVVSWVFYGKDQVRPGEYKVILHENFDLTGMHSCDVVDAFLLVPHSVTAAEISGCTEENTSLSLRSIYPYADSGIESISMEESDEDGGENIALIRLTDGREFRLNIKNGTKGDQGNSGYSGSLDELEIVNNLTQGGAAAALSAEMGKVLDEKISAIIAYLHDVFGDDVFSVEFAESDNIFDPDNFETTLTVVAKLGSRNITSHILDTDVTWSRYSEDANGITRTASDTAWMLRKTAGGPIGKSLHLTAEDIEFSGYIPKVIRFTATVVLRDEVGSAISSRRISYEYS